MVVFNVDAAQVIGLVVSVVLPVLVGLVTTKVTSSGVKAVLLAALAGVTGLGAELLAAVQSGVPYDLGSGLLTALAAFVIAVATHVGIWRPTGVTAAVQAVGGGRHAA